MSDIDEAAQIRAAIIRYREHETRARIVHDVHDVQEVRYWSRRIAEAQATLRALTERGASS